MTVGDLVEHADGRADLARCAVAALQAVVVEEGLLHRVDPVPHPQARRGDDVGVLGGVVDQVVQLVGPTATAVVQVDGVSGSEITGPAFSPERPSVTAYMLISSSLLKPNRAR